MTQKNTGIMIAILGVLVLAPDALLIRLSGVDGLELSFWRGVFTMPTMLCITYFRNPQQFTQTLQKLISLPSVAVIVFSCLSGISFVLGISETSATVVLTAITLGPIFSALLSICILKEYPGWLFYLCFAFVATGVLLVVSDGEGAEGAPDGSAVLGAIYGMFTAFTLSCIFSITRKYAQVDMPSSFGIGGGIASIIAFFVLPTIDIGQVNWLPMIIGGVIVAPISFTLLTIAPKSAPAHIVSLIMLLELVFGSLLLIVTGIEQPSVQMMIGAAVVLIALSIFLIVGKND